MNLYASVCKLMFAENEFKKSCFCFKILFWDSNSIVIEKKTVISPFVSPFLKQYLSSRKPQYRGSSRSETSLMPSSIRWDVCHPVGEFHPIYACHHWSHISVHVSPGSCISWQLLCHRQKHRIRSYILVPPISWKASWLHLCHCPDSLCSLRLPFTSSWLSLSGWPPCS